ncbi:hypothetical protein SARC_11284 [Sphaeroforma arctica JP610]|uniref:Histidine acid phosphatase n=1 Tax=Sphaeroforma arctica JP610 TaxID=667725 RepID=A0A0L0FHH8_9EUKA|nr:hypothetical protein SARC_11284 [Sphaeroforma arctica JP610]KNC76205.1 hypothetical protein SARC_11284 [Sphaeroforma arctica JP610]|eukprot:XP_014150107.1 hypothetical protein SARC_11284 [Sphaeroforma arctica JP610]
MERMSGMLSAWGQATDAQILDLQKTTNVYWKQHYSDYMASRDASSLLSVLSSTLFAPRGGEGAGTTVFVGHDTNIEAIGQLLDLRYIDPRFGEEAAAPMSRLVFNLLEGPLEDSDTIETKVTHSSEPQRYVSARYYSTTLDGDVMPDDGTTVTFLGDQRLQRIGEDVFKARVAAMLNMDCI